jgi:hypothetical protein
MKAQSLLAVTKTKAKLFMAQVSLNFQSKVLFVVHATRLFTIPHLQQLLMTQAQQAH